MSEMKIIDRGKLTEKSGNKLSPTVVDTSKSTVAEVSFHEKKKRKLRRSEDLLDAVKQIDVHVDLAMQKDIVDWVRDQYEKRGGGKLVGLFSRCYLGKPYVDHRLDLVFNIVEHYKPDDLVPSPFDAARTLASNETYAYIEIYADGELVPVRNDGTV